MVELRIELPRDLRHFNRLCGVVVADGLDRQAAVVRLVRLPMPLVDNLSERIEVI